MQMRKPDQEISRGLALVFMATRTRIGVVALLWLLAIVSWWWSGVLMWGMDDGPWTPLGTAGWFLIVWVVMMAAMMFPSVAPTIALYAWMTRRRSPLLPLLFAAGYLAAWAAAGLIIYLLAAIIATLAGDLLETERLRWNSAGLTLIAAAVYQVTPFKNACLEKCRSPFGQLLSSWRDGWLGSCWMGVVNGIWCLGCCWALMIALFALGIMSVAWMAVVAGLIAVEKLLPWRGVAVYGVAGLLLSLGMLMLVSPESISALTLSSATL